MAVGSTALLCEWRCKLLLLLLLLLLLFPMVTLESLRSLLKGEVVVPPVVPVAVCWLCSFTGVPDVAGVEGLEDPEWSRDWLDLRIKHPSSCSVKFILWWWGRGQRFGGLRQSVRVGGGG